MEQFHLDSFDQDEILTLFDHAHDALRAEVDRLPAALWAKRPYPSAWSPAEVVEHVAITHAAMDARIRGHLQDPPEFEEHDEMLAKRALLLRTIPGEGKIQASEAASTFKGLQQGRAGALLNELRASLHRLLQDCDDLPMKAICWPHSIFGKLNGHLWLMYIPLHAERHSRQLRAFAEMMGRGSFS